MKVSKLREFLRGRIGSGDCLCCGKYSVIGLVIRDGLLCFKCMKLVIKYITIQVDGNGAVDKVLAKTSKSGPLPPRKVAKFTAQDLKEMSMGALVQNLTKAVMNNVKKEKQDKFRWLDEQEFENIRESSSPIKDEEIVPE